MPGGGSFARARPAVSMILLCFTVAAHSSIWTHVISSLSSLDAVTVTESLGFVHVGEEPSFLNLRVAVKGNFFFCLRKESIFFKCDLLLKSSLNFCPPEKYLYFTFNFEEFFTGSRALGGNCFLYVLSYIPSFSAMSSVNYCCFF